MTTPFANQVSEERFPGSYDEFLQTPFWQRISLECKINAGFRCGKCRSRRKLQAHHHAYPRNWTDTTLDHLTCLCDACHKAEHGIVAQVPNRKSPAKSKARLKRYLKRLRRNQKLKRRKKIKASKKRIRSQIPRTGFGKQLAAVLAAASINHSDFLKKL